MSSISSYLKVAGAVAAATAFALPSSAQIVIASSNTAFTDISVSGTSPGTSGDDLEFTVTAAQLATAGFTGNGLLAGGVGFRFGNNGGIIWNDSASEIGYTNSTIFGSMAAANGAADGNGGVAAHQFICPLWDDNIPVSGQGANALDWQVIGGNLYVQWSNEDHFSATGTGTVQYQLVVYGGVTIASGNPLVEFVYNDTLYGAGATQNDGGSATIGYKNWGVNASANDVEFGTGSVSAGYKVAGWAASSNPLLPNSVVIKGGGSFPPPPVPVLLTPANNSQPSNPPTLTWAASSGATFYNVDIDGNIFTPVLGTSFAAAMQTVGVHTWTFSAENANGASAYATPFSFTIPTPPPPTICSSPMGGGGLVPPTNTGGTGAVWPGTLPTDVLDVPLVVTVPAGSTQVNAVKLHGLTHTWVGDLQFVLEDPTGLKFNIFYRPQSVANSVGFNCDLAGDYSIYEISGGVMATSCTSGDYQQAFGDWPSGTAGITNTLLSGIVINGASNGTWTLHVYDWAGGDAGALTNWELCFDVQAAPVAFCTSGTSSNGCVPSISANNQPSVAMSNPCNITIANVEGQKFGIIFYGINNTGFSPAQWAVGSNSFLCVKGPTQRTGSSSSGGTILACDGALTLDWNAYQTATPGAVGQPWSVGNKVYVQGWYRDPPAPKTTNLSDALEMTYAP